MVSLLNRLKVNTLKKIIKNHNSREKHGAIRSSNTKTLRIYEGTISYLKINHIRKILNVVKNLPRYNRRYGFFTIEELLKITRVLTKLKIILVENINWKTCTENLVISKYPAKQYQTSISFTFLKK